MGEPTVILKGLVGSHAYGLATPESDRDYAGIFVESTAVVLGLRSYQESIVRHEPNDVQFHEVGKFLRLALNANPTISELLWLKDYEILTPTAKTLIDIRSSLLSQRARKSYGGYAVQQARRLMNRQAEGRQGFDPDLAKRTPKHGRHCARLLLQLEHLLTHGEIQVRLTPTQADHCRRMGALADTDPGSFKAAFEEHLARLDEMPTDLPEHPDIDVANSTLLLIRQTWP